MPNGRREVHVAPEGSGRSSPATVTPEFVLGINYPWVNCGHDFGPSIFGRHSRDLADAVHHFRELRAMGLRVLRWWILAGGVNYPPSREERDAAFEVRERQRGDWRPIVAPFVDRAPNWAHVHLRRGAALPRLTEAFVHDFERLCSYCRAADLLLIPSFVSFEWFLPIIPSQLARGRYGRGRAPLLFDDSSGHRRLEEFIDVTLGPLLRASENWRDTIYAWEVINEPDWSVIGGPLLPDPQYGGGIPSVGDPVERIVQPDEMSDFIELCIERIQDAQFLATIGFKEADPDWLRPALRSRLIRDAARRTYVHQLHHYPTTVDDWYLPDHASLPIRPCMVGEFPAGQGSSAANASWEDDGLAEDDAGRYLRRRLELIERKGYPMALIWSATHNPHDARSHWTPNQQRQVREFTGHG